MKKRWIVLLIFIALIIVAFVSYLFSWRLFGFKLCDHPSSMSVEVDKSDNGVLVVSGSTYSSAMRFAGYKTERKDSTIYVGIKTRLLFTESKLGAFRIEVPIDSSVENVVLTNGETERLIYSKSKE